MQHLNATVRRAERDMYAPHPSGIGKRLVARKGDPLPEAFALPVVTDKKVDGPASSKRSKRQTPSEKD